MGHQESIGKYISFLYRSSQAYISNELQKYNIGSGQYIYLLLLFKNDGINQEALAEQVKVDKATAARAIKILEAEGFITRRKSVIDKRSYEVYLTEKGQEMKPILLNVVKNWSQLSLNGFSEEEKDLLFMLLKKMFHNLCSKEASEQ